jgi:agarase
MLAGLCLVILCGSAGAATVVDLDFTAAEGFSDGADLNGIKLMNAQATWDAGDTAGTGYAVSIGTWQRAKNFADFTLEVGQTVVVETTLRLDDADGIYSSADNFRIGLAESGLNSGDPIPSIGAVLHTDAAGSYWFGGTTAGSRISIDAADAGDWIRFSQQITRSAVPNEFTCTVSASNLTDMADLGSAASWTESTTDGSWGGDMAPSFRTLANTKATALQIDRWTVFIAPDPAEYVLQVDLTRKRSIGGTAALDREQWFGVYHETGFGRKQVTDGAQTLSIDEWINEEGRMWPSRATVDFENMAEDPTRPSYVDPAEFASLNPVFDWRAAWARTIAPNHKYVMSGSGHGRYPAYMCWDPLLTSGIKTVSNNVAHAEAIVNVLAQLESRNGLMPRWFEVMNESSIQSNYGWHWDADAWDKLSAFHAAVGDAVDASVYSNTVKVAGPTDAYPYRDSAAGDFSQWIKFNRKFIQQAGDRMDAYAFHAYEAMDANSLGSNSFDDQFNLFQVWHQGRLPAFIDLWENEHHLIHGGTLPFVFSEYGLLENEVNDPANAYYELRSANGILLSMLDRPDIVDKMSVFIQSHAPYDWSWKQVFFASDNAGTTYYKTSYFEYLRFWHDLEGDYLFSSIGSQHVAAHAFLADSGGTLYLVMKNNHNVTHTIDVQAQLPAGASVASAQIQRLYFNGVDDVARDPFAAVGDLSNIAIDPDETVMLKIQLNAMPDLLTWNELNAYADRTLVPMAVGVPETFAVNLPAGSVEPASEGAVHIGLYSFNGFSLPLTEVTVNGVTLTNVPDIAYTDGAPRCWKQIAVPVPAGILQSGSNTVTVTPAEADSTKKITGVRLTVTGAVSDEDADGMPDWWERDNSLNPFVGDAHLHADSDGRNNGDEYIAGTDPQNGADFLHVTGQSDPQGYRLSVDSKADRVYAFESVDSLQSGWSPLTNGIPGNGEVIEVLDDRGDVQQFYRVQVELP